MDESKSTLARALQLAASGECRTVEDIRYRLRSEGYRFELLTGPSLTKQLRDLIDKAPGPKRS